MTTYNDLTKQDLALQDTGGLATNKLYKILKALREDSKPVSKGGIFKSAVQTGTGAPQNVPHGFDGAPEFVLVIPTTITAGNTFAEGTHTATNCVITATAASQFIVFAIYTASL